MFKKLSMLIAAVLVASPVYAGKLSTPGANDLSGTVVIPLGLLRALQGTTGGLTYIAGTTVIGNLTNLAIRLFNFPGMVEGDPNADPNAAGRLIILHNVDIVDASGNRLTVDISIDRVTREVKIKKAGSGNA
ncbi:MAG TPA: hypothetical protein VM074_04360 [Solimonas sp.]|nr:hypothetical protein [Solimonas sp.]